MNPCKQCTAPLTDDLLACERCGAPTLPVLSRAELAELVHRSPEARASKWAQAYVFIALSALVGTGIYCALKIREKPPVTVPVDEIDAKLPEVPYADE